MSVLELILHSVVVLAGAALWPVAWLYDCMERLTHAQGRSETQIKFKGGKA